MPCVYNIVIDLVIGLVGVLFYKIYSNKLKGVVKLIDLTNILMIDQQRMNQNQVAEKLSLLFILYTS